MHKDVPGQPAGTISFSRALELRLGPSTYVNHQAELFKLCQNSIIIDY